MLSCFGWGAREITTTEFGGTEQQPHHCLTRRAGTEAVCGEGALHMEEAAGAGGEQGVQERLWDCSLLEGGRFPASPPPLKGRQEEEHGRWRSK